jgi:hypothetical protein
MVRQNKAATASMNSSEFGSKIHQPSPSVQPSPLPTTVSETCISKWVAVVALNFDAKE